SLSPPIPQLCLQFMNSAPLLSSSPLHLFPLLPAFQFSLFSSFFLPFILSSTALLFAVSVLCCVVLCCVVLCCAVLRCAVLCRAVLCCVVLCCVVLCCAALCCVVLCVLLC